MSLNKIAYTALVAFVSAVLTLLAAHFLSAAAPQHAVAAVSSRLITLEELATHNHRSSCWKAIDGLVYDVTPYIPEHPGDPDQMLGWCGKDASQAWHNKQPGQAHGTSATLLLQRYLIGQLAPAQAIATSAPAAASTRPPAKVLLGLAPGTYLDGIYRGHFSDRGEMQVSIQFHLRDHHLYEVELRHLAYAGVDYLKLSEQESLYPVLLQYRQGIAHLQGQPLSRLFDLYEPGQVVQDYDGLTGATLRGSKIISTVRDALNRGVYQWR